MNKLLLILILIFSLQSWTRADDIRDFQIEGMSIGDSALDYFSEDDINEAIDESYADRKYLTKTFLNKNLNLYEALQITYKANDNNKIIVGVVGAIFYPNNINKCKKQMYEIASELSDLFPTTIKKDWGKYEKGDNTGHYFPITFDFEDRATAMVSCHDWNKETGLDDNLKVSLFEARYSKYIEGR